MADVDAAGPGTAADAEVMEAAEVPEEEAISITLTS